MGKKKSDLLRVLNDRPGRPTSTGAKVGPEIPESRFARPSTDAQDKNGLHVILTRGQIRHFFEV